MVQNKEKSRKAKKKWATQWINYPLISLDSPFKKYYQRAFFCASVLEQRGKILSSKYCNSRTCITCNGIRTASYISGYGEQVLSFADPQFLTLTAPTVQCFEPETLRYFIDSREFVWRKIYKNSSKSNSVCLIGLKAMEITARPDDYYHIHFHFIIDGLKNAEWVKSQWLKHYEDAMEYLQVIKPITSKGGLLEVFKYGTKFIDKEKVRIKGQVTVGYKKVEPYKTDLIIRALKKKRLISTFGGLRRVKDDDVNEIVVQTEMDSLKAIEYDIWKWVDDVDWFSVSTGEKFSDFVPSKKFREVLSDSC